MIPETCSYCERALNGVTTLRCDDCSARFHERCESYHRCGDEIEEMEKFNSSAKQVKEKTCQKRISR